MAETPPDPADLKAALDKFGDDARLWDEHKEALEKAKSGAEGLDIDALAFGPAAWMGVADRYREVRQMVVDLCREGAAEFGAIAANLRKARDTYRREEDANVHRIKGVW